MNKKSFPLILTLVLILAGVLFLLWKSLNNKPEELPSPLIGKPVPSFNLMNLYNPAHPLTEQNLKGRVALLNVWASWCSACEMEHPMLLEIQKNYPYPIYGINYRDEPQKAKAYLDNAGNPYTAVGEDVAGEVTMDLGVYGTPETFILDKNGNIVHRHIGVMTEESWNTEMLPILKSLE
jgi:cytochrome c biogenesis protein CcmG, thiol:disulfide interchange protein DsbE